MQYNWKRNTVIFLVSQAISLFGSSLVQYAITWYITLETQSGVYATLSIVCGILPTFFLSPFAGVWADRYNRKRLIVLADGGIALCTLIIAIAFMAGHGSVWLLLVALAVRGLGSAVQQPAVSAMLPDMVPSEHLTRVNGIYGSVNSLINLGAPMLSGAMLGFASLQAIFFVDVVTAALAIVVMLTLFALPKKRQGEAPVAAASQKDYFSEMKTGFAYVAKRAYLKSFFAYMTLFCFMAAPVAFLTPLQATRNYGGDVWRLTAIEMAFAVGMTLGGLGIAAWGGLKNRLHTMMLAIVGMGVSTLILGLPMRIPFALYIAAMVLCGLTMPFFNTPAVVILQERVDPDYMGRVFGLVTMVNTSVMPLGMLLFGPLADVVRIEWLLLSTGAIMMLLAIVASKNRPLLEAGVPVKNSMAPEAAPVE